MTCQCPRSAEQCWRRPTTTNALDVPVCGVCHAGCGELRFGLPSDLWVWCRVVSAHEPLRMEYVP